MDNREKLIALGTAIHGPLWQNATGRDLKVNSRQIHRWVSREYTPPDGVIDDLIEVAELRKTLLIMAIRSCKKKVEP
jgi:hypothetical protein